MGRLPRPFAGIGELVCHPFLIAAAVSQKKSTRSWHCANARAARRTVPGPAGRPPAACRGDSGGESYNGHALKRPARGLRPLEFSLPGGARRAVYAVKEKEEVYLAVIVGCVEGFTNARAQSEGA